MTTVLIVWAFAAALLLLLGACLARTVRRSLRCPVLGTDVHVEFLEAGPEGRPLNVVRCSAFTPASAITCGKQCLGRSRLAEGDPATGRIT